MQSHHHASPHHPLSQSTSLLSASCDQRAPISWLGRCHMTQASGRTSPLVPEHAVLSSSSSNLNTQSAAAHFTFLTNQRITFPNVSTLQTTSNSLRLSNKSRKNPLHPAPIRKPANQLAASGLHFPANSAPRPPAASPSPFLAC